MRFNACQEWKKVTYNQKKKKWREKNKIKETQDGPIFRPPPSDNDPNWQNEGKNEWWELSYRKKRDMGRKEWKNINHQVKRWEKKRRIETFFFCPFFIPSQGKKNVSSFSFASSLFARYCFFSSPDTLNENIKPYRHTNQCGKLNPTLLIHWYGKEEHAWKL